MKKVRVISITGGSIRLMINSMVICSIVNNTLFLSWKRDSQEWCYTIYIKKCSEQMATITLSGLLIT